MPRDEEQRLGGEVKRSLRSSNVHPRRDLRQRPRAVPREQRLDEIVEGGLRPRAGPAVQAQSEHGSRSRGVSAESVSRRRGCGGGFASGGDVTRHQASDGDQDLPQRASGVRGGLPGGLPGNSLFGDARGVRRGEMLEVSPGEHVSGVGGFSRGVDLLNRALDVGLEPL